MMRLPVCIAMCLAVAACTRSNMDSQPKYHEYEEGALFGNGRVLQAPVPGTVARGDLALAEEARNKPAVTSSLLERGRDQYDVYCSPCHDRAGTGQGIVVQRGMPQPESLHDEKLRGADDQHFYDVISNGYGAMYAHGDRIRPADRWAIVAYIRALQLSQHATLDDVPADAKQRLLAEPPP
jgi:mono/diheme cytochrome c family protein